MHIVEMVPYLILIVVIIGFAAFIFTMIKVIIKNIRQWIKNNNSPVLSAYAKVVAKRISVSNQVHTDGNGFSQSYSSTSYFVTFQMESGDRLELCMSGNEYGLLVEDDDGKLTFQGTRYIGFKRTI